MKTQIRFLFVALLFIASILGTAFGADKPAKLPVVGPPSKFRLETFVWPTEVSYSLTDTNTNPNGVYAQFVARHDGTLRSLRLIINDSIVYNWDCQSKDGKVITDDNGENGVHQDKTVTINRAKWLAFFQKEVALRSFEFLEEKGRLSVYVRPVEFTGYGKNTGDLRFDSNFRPVGTDISVCLNALDFIVPFPREGQFYLGIAEGRFLPLLKTSSGGWELALDGDRLSTVDELPGTTQK